MVSILHIFVCGHKITPRIFQLLIFLLQLALLIVVTTFSETFFSWLRERKMTQIIACWCTKQKFSEAGVGFYTEQKFYPQIKEVLAAPCPRHPMFKDRFRNIQVDTTCKCLLQERGRCHSCKTKYFNLNFVADKIKVLPETVPSTAEIETIEEYLERDIKTMGFFFTSAKIAWR